MWVHVWWLEFSWPFVMILQVICDCYARYLTHFKMKNFGYSIIHFLRNSFGRELVQYYNGTQCLLPSPFSFKDWLASVFGFWTLVGTYMEYWIVLVYLLRQQNGEWRMENGWCLLTGVNGEGCSEICWCCFLIFCWLWAHFISVWLSKSRLSHL